MKLIYLLLMVLITYSCSTSESNLYEIDPRDWVENKITLADIADDIIYIPLDNRYPIGYIFAVKIVNKSIYIAAKDGIIAFNRDGKMARKIGSIGRGPGEYIYCMYFAVDEKQEIIYAKDRGNIIKVYTKNGNYLRSISLQKYGGNFHEIEFYNSKLFVPELINYGKAKYNWIILDTLGNLIKQKKNSIPSFISIAGNWGGTYKFENKISYWDFYNDTIFSILPDLSYKTSFLFSQGEHRWPRFKIDLSQTSLYLQPISLFETNRFLVFIYSYNKRKVIALIDKKSNKSFLNYLESEISSVGVNYLGGILNNLDGGTMFQPKSYFADNGQEFMIGLINSYQLKIHVASSEFKNSVSKYPEKKEDLKKLADSLKETDNPVLMIVSLKK